MTQQPRKEGPRRFRLRLWVPIILFLMTVAFAAAHGLFPFGMLYPVTMETPPDYRYVPGEQSARGTGPLGSEIRLTANGRVVGTFRIPLVDSSQVLEAVLNAPPRAPNWWLTFRLDSPGEYRLVAEAYGRLGNKMGAGPTEIYRVNPWAPPTLDRLSDDQLVGTCDMGTYWQMSVDGGPPTSAYPSPCGGLSCWTDMQSGISKVGVHVVRLNTVDRQGKVLAAGKPITITNWTLP